MKDTSKVTYKKQVTLPNYVMDMLSLKPADRVEFLIDDSEPAVKKVVIKKAPNFLDFKGSIKPKGKYKNLSDDDAVKEFIKDNYKDDGVHY